VALHAKAQGFANDDASWNLLSDLVQRLIVAGALPADGSVASQRPPTDIFNYWDARIPPDDVQVCLDSWRDAGFALTTYDREAADAFIAEHFAGDVLAAFRYAHHPAMQADLFRLARIHQLGGLYVDADDAFLGGAPIRFAAAAAVKPLAVCRHCPASVPVAVSARFPRDAMNWYYLGNSPISGVAGHPLFERALARAVAAVMGRRARGERTDIHADVGPTSFSLAVLEHVIDAFARDADCDLSVRSDWLFLDQSRPLAYKGTERNWRTNTVLYGPAATAS
jgi:hypothetical protein